MITTSSRRKAKLKKSRYFRASSRIVQMFFAIATRDTQSRPFANIWTAENKLPGSIVQKLRLVAILLHEKNIIIRAIEKRMSNVGCQIQKIKDEYKTVEQDQITFNKYNLKQTELNELHTRQDIIAFSSC